MKGKKTLLILGILATLLLMVTVPAAMAGGKGGEPGSGCPGSDMYKFQYDAPPYEGTMTGIFDGGWVKIFGDVEQVGKSICSASIPVTEPYWVMPLDLASFQNLKAKDLHSLCLVDLAQGGIFPCITDGYLEIVGAGDLKFTSPTSFTVHVIMMHVKVKQ